MTKQQTTPSAASLTKPENADWRRPSDGLTFTQWKAICNKESLGIIAEDAFADDRDDFELNKEGAVRFLNGETPRAFIHDVFSEDLARLDHEVQQALEAQEANEEGDYDDCLET